MRSSAQSDTSRIAAIAIGAVVALMIVVMLFNGLRTSLSNDSNDEQVASNETSSQEETKAPRPEFPELPEGAEPVNDAAKNNEPAGNFNNVWRGTVGTSADFALAVRETYVRHYLETGEFDASITVYSPAVQRNFPLTCTDNDAFVTCALGTSVVVYIA